MPASVTKVFRLCVLLLASGPLFATSALARTFDLCATTGSITLPGDPDPVEAGIWGYVLNPGGGCDGVAGTATLPGPVLRATAGQVVTVNLTNGLPVPTSILIPGQVVSASGDGEGDFTAEADAGSGVASYSFTARTGTYLYESGTNAKVQVAMGLHGALIVDSQTTGRAYEDPSSAFDSEAILVLSEIDPDLNADPLGFEFIVDDPNPVNPGNFLQNYRPVYWLINGKAFPDTDAIPASSDDRVLLRYVNASFTHHSMALLGLHQQIIAREAFELPTAVRAVAETIPAGATADMIVETVEGRFPLYNRNMRLANASSNLDGGMQTFLQVRALPPLLFFATVGNTSVPGVPPGSANSYDDADIYSWNGQGFARVFEARVAGGGSTNLRGIADIDGLKFLDADNFYVSLRDSTRLPGGFIAYGPDIVRYDGGVWSIHFDGSANGFSTTGPGIDAFDIAPDGNIYFSIYSGSVPGLTGPFGEADIYRWDGSGYARVFDASLDGNLPGIADIDGLHFVDVDTFCISFEHSFGTEVPGIGLVEDEDVIVFDNGVWSLLFDGSEAGAPPGLGGNGGRDIDALDLGAALPCEAP